TSPTPSSPLFPYTTLFRSVLTAAHFLLGQRCILRTSRVLVLSEGANLRPRLGIPEFDVSIEEQTATTGDELAIGGKDRPRRLHRSEEHTSELQSRFDLVCR